MTQLIFQTSPTVTVGTNTFTNVPVILQFDDTPLISIIRDEQLGYTTEIPIYHQDGTYLAKVNGTRIFPTEDGKKAGLQMRYPEGMTVCEMAGKPVFEITHARGDAFRTQAELYTPTGYFVKAADSPIPNVLKSDGRALQIGGVQMSGCSFSSVRIGIWLRSDGSCGLGCN